MFFFPIADSYAIMMQAVISATLVADKTTNSPTVLSVILANSPDN